MSTETTRSPGPALQVAIGSSIALGLLVHQVFRKHETYNIAVPVLLLFAPPIPISLLAAVAEPPQWTLLRTWLMTTTTYLATLSAAILVYRLSPLHPLARYPGPVGCKLTKFWMAFIAVPGFQHRYIKSLHDRYGDVVRIGPNELSIRDAKVVNAVLGPNGAPKGPHFFGRFLTHERIPLVAIVDTNTHLQQRRSWGRGMGPAAIKEHDHTIGSRARQLAERLERHVGEEVIIGDWFNFFAYDVMSDMVFGGGSELIAAGNDKGNVWALIEDYLFISNFFGHLPWLGVIVGKFPAAAGNMSVVMKKCAERVQDRLERGSEKKDLFHYLNNEDLPGKAPPLVHQLVDNGILAIVAGSDTTSSALTSLFYSLLTHPDAYKKLLEEIDKFYPLGEDALDTKHYREMPYLMAVINETLRVFPPVPGCTQRQVPPDSAGLVTGNIVIPPGTHFWVHAYSIHHDIRNFSPYTSEFWPERWLLASGELDSSRGVTAASPEFRHDEAGYIPFSAGPMNCVGKTLALQELRMVACALLQKYTVRMRAGWDPREYGREFRDYFASTRPEVPAVLEVRS